MSGCAYTSESIIQFDQKLSNFGIKQLSKLSRLRYLKLNYLGKLSSKAVEHLADGLYKRMEIFEAKDCNQVTSFSLSRFE